MHKKELSFIYTIAHELKAPIITIEGFLNALLKDFIHEAYCLTLLVEINIQVKPCGE